MTVQAHATKGVLWNGAVLFIPLTLIAIGITSLVYREQAMASLSLIQESQRRVVERAHQRVAFALAQVAADTQFLAHDPTLRRWLASGDDAMRQNLIDEYLVFSKDQARYDQIRFIGLDGRERVRVDLQDGDSRAVPDAELQDKGDRYYVRETLKLGPGDIYVSPFNLNRENGAISEPIRPTIRFGMPVFDSEGRKRGMILLNYAGGGLLDQIRTVAAARLGEIWLLNGEGYWLLGPNAADEWAFEYPERANRNFPRAYSKAWARMQSAPSGQFTDDGNLFAYAKVDTKATDVNQPAAASGNAAATNGPRWILVAYVPAAALAADLRPLKQNLAGLGAASLALLAVVSWFAGHHWAGRKAALEAMHSSESRYRGLLQSAPDAVLVTDENGNITFTNAQAEQLFGYRRDQLEGRPIEMLIPARYRERHVRHRSGYKGTTQARAMGVGFQLYGQRSDGSEFPASVSLSSVDTGEGVLVFADIRDVTKEREAEQRLRELNQRLERDRVTLESLNKELEAFSYSVSHDLRAPLRAIDGFSQALLEDCSDRLDEEGRGYLNRMRQAAQRMGLLIDDLLKLSRLTRTELTVANVDLSAMADDILCQLRQGAPERAIETTVAPGLRARGDPRLLRVALENLLGNAWKFTAGRTPGHIEVGLTHQEGKDVFYVRDNGAGFDMNHVGKLFGAFQRLHDASEFPGTGIGLAIVQRVIQRHGGRIWAAAKPGEGATFYFTL